MCVCKSSDMRSNTLGKGRNLTELNVVAAFKNANNSSFTKLISNFLQVLGQPLIIKLIDSCITLVVDGIQFVGVKTCRTEDDVGFEFK